MAGSPGRPPPVAGASASRHGRSRRGSRSRSPRAACGTAAPPGDARRSTIAALRPARGKRRRRHCAGLSAAGRVCRLWRRLASPWRDDARRPDIKHSRVRTRQAPWLEIMIDNQGRPEKITSVISSCYFCLSAQIRSMFNKNSNFIPNRADLTPCFSSTACWDPGGLEGTGMRTHPAIPVAAG
jgi:hypothetical protein